MKKQGVACSPVQRLGWGKRTQIKLPGGGHLGVYQPFHERPGKANLSVTRKPARTPRKAS
jgi:hypothetical protein